MLIIGLTAAFVAGGAPSESHADFKDFMKRLKEDAKQNEEPTQNGSANQQGAAEPQAESQRHASHSETTGGNRGATSTSVAASVSSMKVKEEKLADLVDPRGLSPRTAYVIAPNQTTVATVMRQGSRMAIGIDGKPGPALDEVSLSSVGFSNDSKRFAYVGKKGSTWSVFVDHEPVLELTGITYGHQANDAVLRFSENGKAWAVETRDQGVFAKGKHYQNAKDLVLSSNGKHFAFVMTNPQNQYETQVFLDGKRVGPPGQSAAYPSFTANGTLLHVAWSRGGQQVVYGNKKSQVFAGVRPPSAQGREGVFVFSEDRKHFAFVAWERVPGDPTGHKMTSRVVVDMKPDAIKVEQSSDEISHFVFSPNGTRWAYVAKTVGGQSLIVGGKQVSMEYQSIGQVSFDPAGKHVFAVARHGGAHFILVDDKEFGPYNSVGAGATASPDGKNYAWADETRAAANQPDKTALYVNGKQAQTMNSIWHLSFSPDNQLVCGYQESRTKGASPHGLTQGPNVLRIGDQRYSAGVARAPVFSPDGKHFAYLATDPETRGTRFVVDGKALPPSQFQSGHPHQERLTFTADGKHLVYVGLATPGRGRQLYVEGEAAGSTYEEFVLNHGLGSPSALVPHTDGSVQTLAIRDQAIYRITVSP